MQLRIYIRQTVQRDKSGNFIYYQGNNVNTLAPVIGMLPNARRWANYTNFLDVTDEASDLTKLTLEWTAQADNEGFIAPATFNAKQTASGQITFEGEAYRLIKQWLVDDVSAQINTVDVEIKHIDDAGNTCGVYRNWIVKASDIEWCEDNLCQFDTIFKQADELYNCIKSTIISDNWQQWFQDEPLNKKHPRFSYCNEIRPNFQLVFQWYFMSLLVFVINVFIIPILGIIKAIIWFINNVIIAAINAIAGLLGLNPIPFINDPFPSKGEFNDNIGHYYTEAAGCGREHPAPLIRDYITNVCDKCGVKVDENTAPIFFAENITIETSSRGLVTARNPHYMACYLYAPTRKGVRRFNNISLFGVSDPNTTQFYIFDNRPMSKALDMFLDELKPLYNMEWALKNGYLYIQRKDWFRGLNKPYVLDLSDNGADRSRLLQGICYTWNERKIPAYSAGMYSDDGVDTAGDEAKSFMNDAISYGDASKNPVYDGLQDKKTQFGATRFRGDGVATDYIMDAFQSGVNSNFITTSFGGATLFLAVQPILEKYADYALLMKDDKNNLPKVIIWDGQSYENARAEKTYYGIDTFGAEPPINPKYNGSPAYGWSSVHPPQTRVLGRGLTFGTQTPGLYQVRDIIGTQFYEMKAQLINYPMYMAVGFQDSLWDWFHWIDDPNTRTVLNRSANFKLELCCDLLKRLRLFDSNNTALGERILLPKGESVAATIKVNYDPSSERGSHIEITADS